MRNPKQKTAIVLTGAVALASGAYALGSQADGNAEAAGDRPAAGYWHHGPGPGGPGAPAPFGLERLADRLGVDEDALRDALEDVRGSLPDRREVRGDFAKELADELGTTEAKVEAALERIKNKHAEEFEQRQDALAEALAKRLNLDADKVKDALEAPRLFRRFGP
jgi:Clp amino terminal domain, pathogenicity island component